MSASFTFEAPVRALALCCFLAAAGPVQALAAEFHVDPVGGSDSGDGSAARPWKTIQDVIDRRVETQNWERLPYPGQRLVTVNAGAPVKGGDTLWLHAGDYGPLDVVGAYNLAPVTLAAAAGATVRFTSVRLRSARSWILRGFSVSPSFGGPPLGNAIVTVEDHDWSGPASDVVVEGFDVFTVPDEAAWATPADWDAGSADGIIADGERVTVRGCSVRNVAYGIAVSGRWSRVEHNLVDGFSGDGLRGLGDDEVFEYNLVRNAREVNADHRDGFQSWSFGAGGVGTGVVRNVILRGNVIVGATSPAVRFAGTLQGIGCFDGTYEGWTVENNVVATDHWHGISFYGARSLRIVNNTVLDLNGTDPGPPWIMVTAHKDGTPSRDVLVRNNLTTDLSVEGDAAVSDGNLILPAGAAGFFADPAHHDYRLAAGSPAIDRGIADQAPPADADGVPRPFGAAPDAGAYEWAPGAQRPPGGGAGPGGAGTGSPPPGDRPRGVRAGGCGAPAGGAAAWVLALAALRRARRARPGRVETKRGGPAALAFLALAPLLATACKATAPGVADPDVAPILSSFSAAPSALVAGRSSTVTWTWAYANEPSPVPDCAIAPAVGEVSPGASTSLTLSADTTYTLTCANRAGRASRQATLTAGADLLPPDRLPPPGTWESAGVEGGIPARTAVCATVTDPPYSADPTGSSGAAASIQRAIDGCPVGQVVSIPAGTYLVDATLVLRKGITLRGAGRSTVLRVAFAGPAVRIGSLGPWPPPKANPAYRAPVGDGAARGSTSVTLADASPIAVGDLVMIDEEDDPALVWTKPVSPGRYRASLHLVEAKGPSSVSFRPALPIDYARSPQISWISAPTTGAGVERITFLGTGAAPGAFVDIQAAWNCWVLDCEFSNMPSRTIFVAWAGHVELRRIHMHDQSNGGPNSEGIDLFCDVSWSLVVDSVCVAGGFPQINIGDGGANPSYSGGFGNVIAYNYAVDAYYTDPPTAPDAGKMPADVGTNHSPHSQYNLVEGNVMGKFGSDAYHGSGSHTVLLRNRIFGASRWPGVSNETAVQIDRRNLLYAVVGNVLGLAARPATLQYASRSGWGGSAIFRLGFPDGGNDGYTGTFPPSPLLHGDGGPRDLYVDRDTAAPGTTLIEGNWDSASGRVDWSRGAQPIPESLFLAGKPAWFGSLAWPPVDPSRPPTDDPAIIPAGYRAVHGTDPPP